MENVLIYLDTNIEDGETVETCESYCVHRQLGT